MSIVNTGAWAPQPSTTRSRRTPLSYDSVNDRIVYGSGKLVILRSVEDPEKSVFFTEHTYPVTTVASAPSGHYVASADTTGAVKVWSSTGEEIITKGVFPITSGRLNGVAWDFESKRIIAVGDGKERFGHAILADSGNTVGDISGHSAEINAVAIRPKRPLRAVTVGEDSNVVFYTGVPFKFAKTVGKHTKAVSDVAYSPNGEYFATAGSDRQVALYNGTEGDFIEWLETGHESSVLALAWKDDKHLITAGADASVRIFDVEAKKVIAVFQLEKTVENQQTGVVVTKSSIISVGNNGDLYYWSLDGSKLEPLRVVQGHQGSIAAMVKYGDHVYSGSIDGRVIEWTSGTAKRLPGGHDGPIVGFIKVDGLVSAGWDKKFRKVPDFSELAKVYTQPLAVAGNEHIFLGLSDYIAETSTDERFGVSYGASLDVFGKDLVAIGAGYQVHFHSLPGFNLIHSTQLARGSISFVKFSPNGKYLAAGETTGKITLYAVEDKSIVTSRWSFHTSRITSIAWHEDGERIVSGGLDSNIYVYSVSSPGKNIKFLGAHKDGVTQVDWLDSDKIVSSGSDGSIKTWSLTN